MLPIASKPAGPAAALVLALGSIFLVPPAPVASAASAIPVERFDIDTSHSGLGFSVRFMGLTDVHGRFNQFDGTVMFDPDDPARSTVSLLVRTSSIDTGVEARDKDLCGEGFFHCDSFPIISFKSRQVVKRDGGYVVDGDFTMKGVSRSISIPVVIVHGKMGDAWGNTRVGFAGGLTLNRRDYGIVGPAFWNSKIDVSRVAIADSVRVDLTIEATQPNWDKMSFGAKTGTRSLGEVVYRTLSERGVDAALTQFATLKRDSAAAFSVGQGQLNTIGYRLLQKHRTREAVRVFRANVDAFPDSWNVYDSLAEAYAADGNRSEAIANYHKTLAMNPQNPGAQEALRWLEKN